MLQSVIIGKNISNILSEKRMTQRELANKVGISEVTIGRYINGNREPKGGILMDIAKALDVSVDFLLNTSESNKESYYINPDTAELAQEIFDNPNLRVLMSASRKLSKDDLESLVNIVKSMRKEDDF